MNYAILVVKDRCIAKAKRPQTDTVEGLIALYRQCKAVYPDCVIIAVDVDGNGVVQVVDVDAMVAPSC